MGYSGLSSWIDSDNAADLTFVIWKSVAKELNKRVNKKDNEYNTDGAVDVALFFEGFILKGKNGDCVYSDELKAVAQKAKDRIAKLLAISSKAEDWGSKAMHVQAYRRMIRSLDKFLEQQ